RAERDDGRSRYVLVGLQLEGNLPADGAVIYHKKKTEAGVVTSAAWSPLAKRNLALAVLNRPYGDRVKEDLWAEIYALRELRYHKSMVRAEIVERPFVRLPRRTATPPGDH
ncbi:MAG: glycine cleavage T C-terminal barrel domain-containing protein, partial [Pseudomonadota bacterium]